LVRAKDGDMYVILI